MKEKCQTPDVLSQANCAIPLDAFMDRDYVRKYDATNRRFQIVSVAYLMKDSAHSVFSPQVIAYVIIRALDDGSFAVIDLSLLQEYNDASSRTLGRV